MELELEISQAWLIFFLKKGLFSVSLTFASFSAMIYFLTLNKSKKSRKRFEFAFRLSGFPVSIKDLKFNA